jgi:hypothetical protein
MNDWAMNNKSRDRQAVGHVGLLCAIHGGYMKNSVQNALIR